MANDVVFIPDEIAIAQIRYSWGGMIGRDLNRRLRTLEFRGRMSAGVKTGELKRRMETKRKVIRQGLEGQVGSPVRYAAAHHDGARPLFIRPKKAGALRFVVGGRVVFASRVHHPGNRPNPYLTRWLREAVR